jgi:gliding motility-associated-like protein
METFSKNKFSLVFILFFSLTIYSQNQGSMWYFGNSAALSFNSGTAVSLSNSALLTSEGSASISDVNGNLLFYTGGTTVYNSVHATMLNGTGLFGESISAQSAVIVPLPGSTSIYYVFTMRNWTTPGNGANYSIVDMTLNGGLGDVTTKNVLLNTSARESLTATRHCNNIDYWITFWDRATSRFNTYLLTGAGLSAAPIISNVGTFASGTALNRYGYLKFSQNGKKLAYALGGQALQNNQTTVEVYDFDNSTGIISNPQTLALASAFPDAYSCEFSPSGNLLYVVAFNNTFIRQYNLQAGTTAQIIASQTNVAGASPGVKSCLQMAPDGRMYVALSSQSFVGVINNPNTAGIGCNYVHNVVSLGPGRSCGLGLPNFMQMFYTPPVRLGNDTTACHPVALNAGPGWNNYLWSTGATTQSISVNATGNYWVHVNNGTTCGVLGDTIHVTIATLSGTTIATPVRCFGESNGSATVTISGGTNPYGYLWNNGQTGQSATGLAAGTYSVNVTDALGCIQAQTVSITQPAILSSTVTSTNNTQCNIPNGSASVTATGGTPGYSYAWSNGQTAQSATGLSAGTYTVDVTDTHGCIRTQTVSVAQSIATISIAVTVANNTHCTNPNGAATVTATGGTPGYSYLWSNGQTSPSATGLGAGTYSVDVTDANGCLSTQTLSVAQFTTAIALSTSATNDTHCITPNGSATVTATGGIPGYSYVWSNGQTSPSATGLSAGTYSIEVTDAAGCKNTQTVSISPPPTMSLTTTGTDNTHCTAPNGTASVVATAGTPAYSYLWSNGQTSPSATGLNAGSHTVTVSDANGCKASQTVKIAAITSTPSINLSVSSTVIVAGDQAQLTASGGGTYDWFMSPDLSCNSCPNPIASPLKTTSYCVQVSDINGCEAKDCITIEVESAVYVPNAFTPNEDGLNDIFKPIIENVHDYELLIFDRWGEQLFKTSNTEEGWDGSYRQKACKSDVYVYKIMYTDDFKKKSYEQFGKVTLVK